MKGKVLIFERKDSGRIGENGVPEIVSKMIEQFEGKNNAVEGLPEGLRLRDIPVIICVSSRLYHLRKSDPQCYNEKNIRERQKLLEQMTVAELVQILTKSNQALIREKPSLYFAILEEIRGRKLLEPQE